MHNWLLPEYVEDILPAEALHIEVTRRQILDLLLTHGYQQVIPPLLEYVESLLSGSGSDMNLQTFKVIDQLSGRIAKKQGVELTSSEYRLINEKDARMARYEMVLPVRGKYSQIRAFIADALEAVPAMAISAIAMKRESTAMDKLEVRLEINLYMNK